jgi:hypothetical protein
MGITLSLLLLLLLLLFAIEVREDGRMVGGEEWQEKVNDKEEWKRLLRTARNRRILHTPMD